MFTHLHTHSYYSLLRGASSPEDLVKAAAADGARAIALTDYAHLSGAVEFSKACTAHNIQPVIGLEVMVNFPHSPLSPAGEEKGVLVFLAMNRQGWRTLCKISSNALNCLDKIATPEIDFDFLGGHNDGLLCLTGGANGLLEHLLVNGRIRESKQHLEVLKDFFDGRLYVELQKAGGRRGPVLKQLNALAEDYQLPAVATDSVYYLKSEQEILQKTVAAIRLHQPINSLNVDDFAPPGSAFSSGSQIEDFFQQYPEEIQRTQEIVERCQYQLELGVHHFPEFESDLGETPQEQLKRKVLIGAQKKYGEISERIENRINRELNIIADSGFGSIFLIMEAIMEFCDRADIPFSSRGSAAGSLLAHCLGITTPDPLRLNLYFERFLNPARQKPPDIDTDLSSTQRDEVINYVYQRYGVDKVAMVSTINRFRKRSAVQETIKALGLTESSAKQLLGQLPGGRRGPPRRDKPKDAPFAEIVSKTKDPEQLEVLEIATSILNIPRHLSIHPGGLVIAPGEMTDYVPTQMSRKGILIAQFDLEPIEQLGLVKIDLLGTRGLAVLGDVAEEICNRNIQFNRKLDVLHSIPLDDPETSERIRNGETIGCFGIESPGMRSTLCEINAQTIDDVMVALALYRPGPMSGGLKDAFVNRHLGHEPVEHLHPALEELLEDTYGVILYQEQVLRISNELAGLSLAEGDLLRRAMSHFDPGKKMQTLKQKFIAGAGVQNNVPEKVAEQIWEMMAAFAGYGFPKAHAASYALVSWRSAWCKTHHPAQFMAAVMANWGGYYRQEQYLMESRRLGLTLKPPHINHSRKQFSVDPATSDVLYMGLDQVRDLTKTTQQKIITGKPFISLNDLMTRAAPRQKEAEHLIRVGALEGLGTIPTLLRDLQGKHWQAGQFQLFPVEGVGKDADWSVSQKAAAQKKLLGASLMTHPLEQAEQTASRWNAINTVDAKRRAGQRVRVLGVRQHLRSGKSRSGERFHTLELEDLHSTLKVTMSDQVYRRYQSEFRSRNPIVIEGRMDKSQRTEDVVMRAEKAVLIK